MILNSTHIVTLLKLSSLSIINALKELAIRNTTMHHRAGVSKGIVSTKNVLPIVIADSRKATAWCRLRRFSAFQLLFAVVVALSVSFLTLQQSRINSRSLVVATEKLPFRVTDENAVEVFRTFMLNRPPPLKVPYNGIDTERVYFSQVEQDKAVDEILHQKRNGFFIEVGAYDGVSFSNSLFFEKFRNWTGLLIEANPRAHRELLAKDRKAWNTPACISTSSHVELNVDFVANGMIGGFDGPHFERSGGVAKDVDTNPFVYNVKAHCFPLNVMLDAIGVNYVDMFSLDVEGAELEVLKSIDFSRVTIAVLVIEKNYKEDLMFNFLKDKGYRRHYEGKWSKSDAIYLHASLQL